MYKNREMINFCGRQYHTTEGFILRCNSLKTHTHTSQYFLFVYMSLSRGTPHVVFQVKLGILDYALHTLNQIQRKWVYLEPIFGMGALPAEQGRFRRVEEEFRDIMANVRIVCNLTLVFVLHGQPSQRRWQRRFRPLAFYCDLGEARPSLVEFCPSFCLHSRGTEQASLVDHGFVQVLLTLA